VSQPPFLPYGNHCIDDDDIEAVARVLRSDRLTGGPTVEVFEEAFAAAVDAPHAIACANGTAALHLTSLALGLGPGDFVVIPAVTFLATANAARYVGADVVFADVDPETGLMGADQLETALATANGVKAVYPVHLNGQCADGASIARVAADHDLCIVEDACHALGGRARDAGGDWRAVGSCAGSDMAMFSFHPVKTIAMGEGGAVTTADDGLAQTMRDARNHGIIRDPARWRDAEQGFAADGAANPWYYEMHEPSFNYRASDIHCALGLSQLGKLAHFVERRRALSQTYDRLLAPLAPTVRPVGRTAGSEPAWHLYAVLIDFAAAGTDRAAVMRHLESAGIGTQVHYLPVHRQPYYRDLYEDVSLPGADAYYDRVLSLPLFPAMADDDVERVVTALAESPGIIS
jgi:UDP-4-amino-4,6-dideoxy-N-acetyl-beta-L-altrosamine transaminase